MAIENFPENRIESSTKDNENTKYHKATIEAAKKVGQSVKEYISRSADNKAG